MDAMQCTAQHSTAQRGKPRQEHGNTHIRLTLYTSARDAAFFEYRFNRSLTRGQGWRSRRTLATRHCTWAWEKVSKGKGRPTYTFTSRWKHFSYSVLYSAMRSAKDWKGGKRHQAESGRGAWGRNIVGDAGGGRKWGGEEVRTQDDWPKTTGRSDTASSTNIGIRHRACSSQKGGPPLRERTSNSKSLSMRVDFRERPRAPHLFYSRHRRQGGNTTAWAMGTRCTCAC